MSNPQCTTAAVGSSERETEGGRESEGERERVRERERGREGEMEGERENMKGMSYRLGYIT